MPRIHAQVSKNLSRAEEDADIIFPRMKAHFDDKLHISSKKHTQQT
jgi:hypothetical protein